MAEPIERMGGSAGGLSQSQEMALAALRGGQTFVRAAEEAGVTRMTLYRWLRGNAHFRAAFNAWQEEAVESARARLVKLADQAVDVVEQALRRSDEKVALRVLRSIGATGKREGQSVNPEVLSLKMELRDKRELRQAEMEMLDHLMEKAGVPAKQRRAVMDGGAQRAQIVEAIQQQKIQSSRFSKAQTIAASDSSQAAPRAVTPQSDVQASESQEKTVRELCNHLQELQLDMELIEAEDDSNDVTDGVGASQA